jgi:lysophospholipase L1-like esterase
VSKPYFLAALLGGIFLLAACGGTSPVGNSAIENTDDNNPAAEQSNWLGAWGTAQYANYPAGPLDGIVPAPLGSLTTPSAFPDEQAVEQSFRMIAHPTIGGDRVRLRLSNLLGDRAITFADVRLALRAANAAIIPNTDTAVTFDGQPELVLAPGLEAISDPLNFSIAAKQDVAISFYIRGSSGPLTWHSVSFDTQYVTPQNAGNTTSDVTGTAFSEVSVGWFFVSGLDVERSDSLGTIVALGDSITDGAYQTPGTNTRWPDLFAQRLQAAAIPMGVLNKGINSNRITRSGNSSGAAALLRFDRDVLQRPGVRALVIHEGTNDITAGANSDEIIDGLNTLITRAHNADLCVVLTTIMPRDDVIFGWDRASMESTRIAVNDWIRNAGATGLVESVVDFEPIMGAPGDNSRPNPALFTPDLLHPSSLGFLAMANAIPIDALVPAPAGNCRRGN